MDGGDWISLAGVVIAGGSAIWSAHSACSAKDAERRAEQRADAAVQAARGAVAAQRDIAEHLKRSAELDEQRGRVEADQVAAIHADPWLLEPMPDGDCWLINRSTTAKYGVQVTGYKVHEEEVRLAKIGPGKRVELGINRIMHPDDDIEVTWHHRQDLSDGPSTSTETIPSTL